MAAAAAHRGMANVRSMHGILNLYPEGRHTHPEPCHLFLPGRLLEVAAAAAHRGMANLYPERWNFILKAGTFILNLATFLSPAGEQVIGSSSSRRASWHGQRAVDARHSSADAGG